MTRGSRVAQLGAKTMQECAQEVPEGAQEKPCGGQKWPRGSQGRPEGAQGGPKGTQKAPKSEKNAPKKQARKNDAKKTRKKRPKGATARIGKIFGGPIWSLGGYRGIQTINPRTYARDLTRPGP